MKKIKILLFTLTFLVFIFSSGVGSASAEDVTWNPNDKGSAVQLLPGNLTANCVSNEGIENAGVTNVRASAGKTQGKWYWEITADSTYPNTNAVVGVASPLMPISTSAKN